MKALIAFLFIAAIIIIFALSKIISNYAYKHQKIELQGDKNGKKWTSKVEFTFSNAESFSCKVVLDKKDVPEEVPEKLEMIYKVLK